MAKKTIEVPFDKLPQMATTTKCRFCDQPMQLIQPNEHTAFWIHRGEQLKKCHKIAFSNSYSRFLREDLKRKQENLAKQATEGSKDASEASNVK